MGRSSEPSPEPRPSLSPLHAEQKNAVETLSNQVEYMQQRDVHQANELDRLRRLVNDVSLHPSHGPAFQSPPKGMRPEHLEEIETLRREKRDLQLHNCELEVQIQDAAQSIEGFSTAIEKLEEGYKTKEDTWKRQISDLQKECDGLARTNRKLQAQIREKDEMKVTLDEKEDLLNELQIQYDSCKVKVSELSNDRKRYQSTEETLRATQAALEQSESVKSSLAQQLDSLRKQHDETMLALNTKSRQMVQYETTNRPQGQSVLVRTLREEVRLLKGKLEEQFRDEKNHQMQRIQALESQIITMQHSLRQRDVTIQELNRNMTDRDQGLHTVNEQKHALEIKTDRLDRELAAAQQEIRQIHECRGFLGENIEMGFKELLEHDEEIQTLEKELKTSQNQVQDLTFECQRLREEITHHQNTNNLLRQQLSTAHEDLTRQNELSKKLRTDVSKVPELLSQVQEMERRDAMHQTREQNLRRELETLQNQLDAQADYNSLREKNSTLEHQIATWQHQKDDVRSRDTKMKQLLERLETISERNFELDEALQRALKQSKNDQTDMIALKSRLKASKHKVDKYDEMKKALEVSEDKLRDATTMKHMFKQQNDTLKRKVEELETNQATYKRTAEKWKRNQNQMQSIVESHTKELVQEIETLQRRLGRATKKYESAVEAQRTLELKVHEKNEKIAKLYQMASQTPSQRHVISSPQASTKSSHHSDDRQSLSPPRERDPTSLNLLAGPAEEMESLLKNLETMSRRLYK